MVLNFGPCWTLPVDLDTSETIRITPYDDDSEKAWFVIAQKQRFDALNAKQKTSAPYKWPFQKKI